jgi:hypothetical protein
VLLAVAQRSRAEHDRLDAERGAPDRDALRTQSIADEDVLGAEAGVDDARAALVAPAPGRALAERRTCGGRERVVRPVRRAEAPGAPDLHH